VTAIAREADEALGPPLPVPGAGEAVPTCHQRAFFPEAGEVALPRYLRESVRPGVAIAGPALIEDDWSTTIVPPGQRCAATPSGDLVIEVEA
jgi:N-methylhydantoinase A